MVVREAVGEDYEDVLELMGHLHPGDQKASAAATQSTFNEILNSSSFTITVAVINRNIVGSCYINIVPNLTRLASPYGVIENVVTHPNYRRQGIGKSLVKHALQYAKDQQCYKVMLLTGGDKNVQEFYKSCGMKSGTKTAFIERWDAD